MTDWAKNWKEQGYKILVAYMPITGAYVHTRFFLSALSMFGSDVINDLEKRKVKLDVRVNKTFPIDRNRNEAVEQSINDGADYILFLDTDQTFPVDTITGLLDLCTDEKPVICGMYYKKGFPFNGVVGRYIGWDEPMKLMPTKEEFEKFGWLDSKGNQTLLFKEIHYFDKTVPFWVDTFGTGCVLVKADVFKKLPKPYFKYGHNPMTKDETILDVTEDTWFCSLLKKHDISVWCNPKIQCEHWMEQGITDEYQKEAWKIYISKRGEEGKKLHDLLIDVRNEQHG